MSYFHVHTPLFTNRTNRGRSKGGEFGDNVEECDLYHIDGGTVLRLARLGLTDADPVLLGRSLEAKEVCAA